MPGNKNAGQTAVRVLTCIRHHIIREWGAVCVTRAQDVIEHVSPVGEGLAARRLGPACPRDSLEPVSAAVLEAVPGRGGGGPAVIAAAAGGDLNTAIGGLGPPACPRLVGTGGRGGGVR